MMKIQCGKKLKTETRVKRESKMRGSKIKNEIELEKYLRVLFERLFLKMGASSSEPLFWKLETAARQRLVLTTG